MINVPSEAPENMEKALRKAVELIGAQLNEIADKYKVTVSATAYIDEGDEHGKRMYISVANKKYILSVFRHLTGEYAEDTEDATFTRRY